MSTTFDYDFMADVSAGVPTTIAQAFYEAAIIPDYYKTDTDLVKNIEFFLESPIISFVPDPSLQVGKIGYGQKFTLRADSIPGEIKSFVQLQVPIGFENGEFEGAPA